jgi:tetratricopeptide (TPR) repeat protein
MNSLANPAVIVLLISGILATFVIAVIDGQLRWIVEANLDRRAPRIVAGILCIALLCVLVGILWPPADFASTIRKAGMSLQKGRLEIAIEQYTAAASLARQPHEKGDAYRGLADTYKGKGRKEDVVRAFEYYKMAASEEDPAQDQASDCSGCGQENRDLQSATGLSSRVPDADLANAWMRLAKHEDVAGLVDEGEAAWEQVVDLSADQLTSWTALEVSQQTYHLPAAPVTHSVVTCLHQNHPLAQPSWADYESAYRQAKAIENSGNLPRAICEYEKTGGIIESILAGQPQALPEWVRFYYKDFGRALVRAGYYTLALKQLGRAQQLHTDDVWVLGGMADAYRGLRSDEACTYYKKAVSAATSQDDPRGDLRRAATSAGCTI